MIIISSLLKNFNNSDDISILETLCNIFAHTAHTIITEPLKKPVSEFFKRLSKLRVVLF
jgi:hypothetical protein